ncbi:MAG: hypothetical protein LBH51_10190 [Treponema sp.]|jgi:hypothetical protein|nr:hypothetical protein [Treponema sp.]
MGEQEVPGRPNEGIPLSEARPGEEGVQYYYSREHRLAKAPDSVRALYGARERPKFNLMRPLLSSRSNAILFAAVAALTLITLVMGLSGVGESDYYGNRIAVTADQYDGATVITLKKTRRRNGMAYTGPLDIAVFPQAKDDSGPAAYPSHINLGPQAVEEFHFSVPFGETELVVEISHEGTEEGRSLAFKVKTK